MTISDGNMGVGMQNKNWKKDNIMKLGPYRGNSMEKPQNKKFIPSKQNTNIDKKTQTVRKRQIKSNQINNVRY